MNDLCHANIVHDESPITGKAPYYVAERHSEDADGWGLHDRPTFNCAKVEDHPCSFQIYQHAPCATIS